MYPTSIQNLIKLFSKLPAVGQRTASRYVFNLLKRDSNELKQLANSLLELQQKIKRCKKCNCISELELCNICNNVKRDQALLCLVSDSQDMFFIESSNQYSGVYFNIGGLISVIDGVNPQDLEIRRLENYLRQYRIREIIIGLDPSIEGETTAMYISKILSKYDVKVTRLARGLPTGASLEYADEMTLGNAFRFRSSIK